MNNIMEIHTELMARHFKPLPGLKNWMLRFLHRNKGASGYYEVLADRRVERNRMITDAYVAFLVDQHQTESALIGDFKYHDSGTGVGAEAAGDTALGTPCGDARDSGTQIEGATANIYKSVAEHTYDETLSITEHGLFNAASNGTLMDRTKFTAISVVNTSKIEFTFQITFTAGN